MNKTIKERAREAVGRAFTIIVSYLSKAGLIALTLAAMLLYTQQEFDILKDKTGIDISSVLSDVYIIATSDSVKLKDLKTWNDLVSMIPPKLKDFSDELSDSEAYIGRFAENFSDSIDIIAEANKKIWIENEKFFNPDPKIPTYSEADWESAGKQAAEIYAGMIEKYKQSKENA